MQPAMVMPTELGPGPIGPSAGPANPGIPAGGDHETQLWVFARIRAPIPVAPTVGRLRGVEQPNRAGPIRKYMTQKERALVPCRTVDGTQLLAVTPCLQSVALERTEKCRPFSLGRL